MAWVLVVETLVILGGSTSSPSIEEVLSVERVVTSLGPGRSWWVFMPVPFAIEGSRMLSRGADSDAFWILLCVASMIDVRWRPRRVGVQQIRWCLCDVAKLHLDCMQRVDMK